MQVVSGFVIGFFSLMVGKTIAEPVAQRLGQLLLARLNRKLASAIPVLLPKVFDALDKDFLPGDYLHRGISVYDWLTETCLPEAAAETGVEIDSQVATDIARYVVKNFSLQKHFEKILP